MPKTLRKFNAEADLEAQALGSTFTLATISEDGGARYMGHPEDALELATWLIEFLEEEKPEWFTEDANAV